MSEYGRIASSRVIRGRGGEDILAEVRAWHRGSPRDVDITIKRKGDPLYPDLYLSPTGARALAVWLNDQADAIERGEYRTAKKEK